MRRGSLHIFKLRAAESGASQTKDSKLQREIVWTALKEQKQTHVSALLSSLEYKKRMDFLTCVLLNCPFVILNIVANAFYTFCMMCPLHRDRTKQPLQLLLASLICCTVVYQMASTVLFFSSLTTPSKKFIVASNVILIFSLSSSVNSSVWLSFFYCTQIVPVQRELFIWIKKNIKPIIYCIWVVERIFSVLDVSSIVINYLHSSDGFTHNYTMYPDTIYLPIFSFELQNYIYTISVCIGKAHLFFCLCVMVMSSGSTVVYLCRHMWRMAGNGQPLFCPRLKSQVRVAATGFLQGILYLCTSVWAVCNFFPPHTPPLFFSPNVSFTVMNLYMSGTTFSLGAGQTVFRQRMADIWIRAAEWCKTPKVQHSDEGG